MNDIIKKETVEDRIGYIIKKTGLSETKIAIKSQVAIASVTKACRNNKISFNIAFKIAKAFMLNPQWLANGEGDPELEKKELIKFATDIISETNKEVNQALCHEFSLDASTFDDIKKPNILTINVALTSYDNNSEAKVLIDESDIFLGDGLYVVEIFERPKLYFIKTNPTGDVTLSTPNTEEILSENAFKKLKILGTVKAITKKIA